MYKKALIILSMWAFDATGQVKPPKAINHSKDGIRPFENLLLFDLNEISSKKIDTAFIIYHPSSWADVDTILNTCNCNYDDTLYRYVFDKKGRIKEVTDMRMLPVYSHTTHYDTTGKAIGQTKHSNHFNKPVTKHYNYSDYSDPTFTRAKSMRDFNGDSLVTTTHFLKNNGKIDTAAIVIERFSPNHQLLEIKSDYKLEDCTGSSTFHFRYEYDDKGRLKYYRNFKDPFYERFSFTAYGMLTETFDSLTNQLQKSDIILIKETEDYLMLTTGVETTTLTRLEKNSTLFKLKTVVTAGKFPIIAYYEIVYK